VIEKNGERGRNRTFNLLIKSQLLCQLSYAPTVGISGKAQTKIIAFNFHLRGKRDARRSACMLIFKHISNIRPGIPLVGWFVRNVGGNDGVL
jgi:hypothetical protein